MTFFLIGPRSGRARRPSLPQGVEDTGWQVSKYANGGVCAKGKEGERESQRGQRDKDRHRHTERERESRRKKRDR